MSALASALLDSLDETALRALAQRLKPYLPRQESARSPWMNTKDAAAYLDCPESRIYDLVALGKLTAYKDGARSLYRRDELDAYLEAGC